MQPTSEQLSGAARFAGRLVQALKRAKDGKHLTRDESEAVETAGGGASKLPVYATMKMAAAATGIPLAVWRHSKAHGCPAWRPNSSVVLSEFLAWSFGQLKDATELPEGLASWGEAFAMEKALRERNRRMIEEGKLMSSDDGKRQAAEASGFLFGELHRLQHELPAALMGLDGPGMQSELEKAHEELKERARERFKAIGHGSRKPKKFKVKK
jgi:hypothetical protein